MPTKLAKFLCLSIYRASRKLILPEVEHRSRNAKVAGSIPSRGQVELIFCLPAAHTRKQIKTPTHYITSRISRKKYIHSLTSRSQLDLVAQTVEHRSRNAKVAGSIPSRGQVEFFACPVWYTLV